MKELEVLAGNLDLDKRPLPAFSDDALNFIQSLSSRLFASRLVRLYPDLAALAFWGRKANLQKLALNYPERANRLGRGLCFHITPANIPVNFAFSWLFSLLAGNANIVRLPGKRHEQNLALCKLANELLQDFPEVAKRTTLITYPRNDELTAAFCLQADVRMLWGGDLSIGKIRALPARVNCVDIIFADRYSIALFNGRAILESSDAQLERLAENFYNDTFLMDQNACSSPQIILWENDSPQARARFWQAVENWSAVRYELAASSSMDKFTLLCNESIDNPNLDGCIFSNNLLYRLQISSADNPDKNLRGKAGYFHEISLADRAELAKLAGKKVQTITCFGIDMEELRRDIISFCPEGIDRIVPVGQAMAIGLVWDGYDLIRLLSRIIALE